jgi:hypothetical protein
MKLSSEVVSIRDATIVKRDWAPRLSAAIIIPSLYLIARTLVPLITGYLDTWNLDSITQSI